MVKFSPHHQNSKAIKLDNLFQKQSGFLVILELLIQRERERRRRRRRKILSCFSVPTFLCTLSFSLITHTIVTNPFHGEFSQALKPISVLSAFDLLFYSCSVFSFPGLQLQFNLCHLTVHRILWSLSEFESLFFASSV